ncbi:MAG: hypothetical protein JSV84_02720 [Gemmatimonadota bacterium]|nr:MAG: hypothetical protein JSV84_02720 [Gemmatimonadota bacterium]
MNKHNSLGLLNIHLFCTGARIFKNDFTATNVPLPLRAYDSGIEIIDGDCARSLAWIIHKTTGNSTQHEYIYGIIMNTGVELFSVVSPTIVYSVIPGLSRNLLNRESVASIEEIPAFQPG